MEHIEMDWCQAGKVYIVFPYLFNLYADYILRKGGLKGEHSFRTGGTNVNNLFYADETKITKLMVTGTVLRTDSKDTEVVDSFCFKID